MSKKELTDLQKLENRVAASFNFPLPYDEETGAHRYTNRYTSNSEYANKMCTTTYYAAKYSKSFSGDNLLQAEIVPVVINRPDIIVVDSILGPKHPRDLELGSLPEVQKTHEKLTSLLDDYKEKEMALMGSSLIHDPNPEDQ